MIESNNLRKGTTFTHDNHLWKVLDYSHNKTARGGATIRVKCRNLRTGATVDMTFTGNDRLQDIRLDHQDVQYLYRDGNLVHFMDLETYEQPVLNASTIEESLPYLLENLEVKLTSYEGEPLDLELPTAVDMKVTQADIAVRGDTASSLTKQVTVETGLQVSVPHFIEEGDTIRVDTRTGAYVTRV